MAEDRIALELALAESAQEVEEEAVPSIVHSRDASRVAEGSGIEGILSSWEVSDIDITSLESNHAAGLRALGVVIRARDIFQLFEDSALVDSPCVVVLSCVFPPGGHREYLDSLIRRYVRRSPGAVDRRLIYETMTYEAVIGQLPFAVVISISRRTDTVRASGSPAQIAMLQPIEGYHPKICAEWAQSEAIQNIGDGRDMVVKITSMGDIDPTAFINRGGKFDLISMCTMATRSGWRILFLGDGDGELGYRCARQVSFNLKEIELLPVQPRPSGAHLQQRTFGRVDGGFTFREFHDYAKDYRIQQIMDSIHPGQDPWPSVGEVSAMLQPHVNLNAGMMWLFASRE